MKRTAYIVLPLLVLIYLATVISLTDYMRGKPFIEKVGYIPTVNTMKVMSADHREAAGAWLIMKVLFYYGGLLEKAQNKIQVPVDYQAMSRTLHAALRLDPYNMDGYYFAQAILAWDAGQAKIANDLLKYGMKYRDWDWYLPYFAGFNSAFFLKDYAGAAMYYQRAAELSGEPLFQSLASRYFHDSGQTDLAISYLGAMAKSARNESVRKTLSVRRQAFMEVKRVEVALERYRQDFGMPPQAIEVLVSKGYLPALPRDPYGGTFYLAPEGKVMSTSGFSFSGAAKGKEH